MSPMSSPTNYLHTIQVRGPHGDLKRIAGRQFAAAVDLVGASIVRDLKREIDKAWFTATTADGPSGLPSLTTSVASAGGSWDDFDWAAAAISAAETQTPRSRASSPRPDRAGIEFDQTVRHCWLKRPADDPGRDEARSARYQWCSVAGQSRRGGRYDLGRAPRAFSVRFAATRHCGQRRVALLHKGFDRDKVNPQGRILLDQSAGNQITK